MERIQKNHSSTVALIGLAAAGALALSVNASGQLLDDFEDGNDDGWTHFTVGDVSDPQWTVVEANTKVYRLSAIDDPPSPPTCWVGSTLDLTENPYYSNGRWWATVVMENENSTFFLVMRGDHATETMYGFGWYEMLTIRRWVDGYPTFLGNADYDMQVGQEYVVEASAVGDCLELRMWSVDEDRPDLPQLAVTDSTITSGVNGFFVRSQDLGPFSGTFDNVSFAPPCPADVTGNLTVDIDDVFAVLAAWGDDGKCREDVNDDGTVDIDDIFEILANWGPCP